jgi:protein-disulfide isomerase
VKKFLRIGGIILVVGALIATIIISTTKKASNSELVWDEAMTMGNPDAKNYYIIYSDFTCPYCVYFEEPIIEHQENFDQYIKDNDILIEIRLSDFLYEYGVHPTLASRYGAEAAYCAKDEGKFWDYYNLAINTVYNDFFSGGIKTYSNQSSDNKDYWLKIGASIGLGDSFVSCVENDVPLDTIIERAGKTAKLVSGLPYFKFNDKVFSGFTPNGTYGDVLMYLESALKK